MNNNIGISIRRAIDARGLKHIAVAKKAGFSQQAMSDMLTGRRVVKAVDIVAISTATGISPDELLGMVPECVL